MPTGFPPEVEEEKVIKRFIASLKSQIQAARHRKGKAGKPFFLGFIWVKEQVTDSTLIIMWCYYLTGMITVILVTTLISMEITWLRVAVKLGVVH